MHNNLFQIYIVDDHQIVIEGIKSLLENEAKITVVGFATNGQKCLDFLKRNKVDVVLMDINLPDVSGIELCEKVLKNNKSLKIIAISSFSQGTYIRKMMEKGAHGYLLKNANKYEIIKAIEIVMQGGNYLTPEAEKAFKFELNLQNSLPKITKREIEVLRLIVEGYTNNQISEKLFVSTDTIDSHRKNLYSKLNVNNTATLISCALEKKLLESN
ncbi:MAG: response regulator transcription factor [Flavobacteriaceae bacterium]